MLGFHFALCFASKVFRLLFVVSRRGSKTGLNECFSGGFRFLSLFDYAVWTLSFQTITFSNSKFVTSTESSRFSVSDS